MATVLVTHPASRLPTYFGERALGQLREFAEVRLNPSEQDWQGADLVAAAQGCDIIIAYRQTPFDAAVFAALPQMWAVCRCAMDIRTIDVNAASQNGILVTRASAACASRMPTVKRASAGCARTCSSTRSSAVRHTLSACRRSPLVLDTPLAIMSSALSSKMRRGRAERRALRMERICGAASGQQQGQAGGGHG